MDLFSWIKGKKKIPLANSIPDDYTIAGKIASIIQSSIVDDEVGIKELLEPNCATVLYTNGMVGLHWLSGPESMQNVVSFALINRLPAFNSFVASLNDISKLGNSEVIDIYLQSVGFMTIDTIAKQALFEMKNNANKK